MYFLIIFIIIVNDNSTNKRKFKWFWCPFFSKDLNCQARELADLQRPPTTTTTSLQLVAFDDSRGRL